LETVGGSDVNFTPETSRSRPHKLWLLPMTVFKFQMHFPPFS